MNRKQWIVVGILVTILLVIGVVSLLGNNAEDSPEAIQEGPVPELTYCNEENSGPCIVSFGLDADGDMLVNLLLPSLSYPHFRLKILRGETGFDYACRRLSVGRNNAYCSGEKVPPGEILHLMLISTRGGDLLAEGYLSIIGLAFPTVGVVSVTPEIMPTEPTAIPLTGSPTSTPTQFQPFPSTPTRTKPSYPSYP
ncbi:MAG: hypothetical protein L6Q26_09755 [Anaerolineales bacterium]|nr:hypothetical protein [Anaerolineales bacterium]NUQ86611.1 hypothetical protein [Anaerolineales bacterium]